MVKRSRHVPSAIDFFASAETSRWCERNVQRVLENTLNLFHFKNYQHHLLEIQKEANCEGMKEKASDITENEKWTILTLRPRTHVQASLVFVCV